MAVAARDPVIEFVVMLGEEDGALYQFIHMLSAHGNFILAFEYQRCAGHGLLRFITSSPEDVRELFNVQGVAFREGFVVVVRVRGIDQTDAIYRCLMNNEIVVECSYGLMAGVIDGQGLVLHVERDMTAIGALTRGGFEVLSPSDLVR